MFNFIGVPWVSAAPGKPFLALWAWGAAHATQVSRSIVVVAKRAMARYPLSMFRPAYLAGRWYPSDERTCREALAIHAADAPTEQGSWRGAVVPHAGWLYSGQVAAQTLCQLSYVCPQADLVVVFGAHRTPNDADTLFRAEGWQTPLGNLCTAHTLLSELNARLDLDEEPVRTAYPDNAAEVLMPMVRYFFPKAELLMLGVAPTSQAMRIGVEVGTVVHNAGRAAVFIGSTDLTHYGPD
ncbi:MAG: AmmeMemoRadiSam system protein B, partial [Myxococcota bacterium]